MNAWASCQKLSEANWKCSNLDKNLADSRQRLPLASWTTQVEEALCYQDMQFECESNQVWRQSHLDSRLCISSLDTFCNFGLLVPPVRFRKPWNSAKNKNFALDLDSQSKHLGLLVCWNHMYEYWNACRRMQVNVMNERGRSPSTHSEVFGNKDVMNGSQELSAGGHVTYDGDDTRLIITDMSTRCANELGGTERNTSHRT